MATKEQLIQAMSARIARQFDETDLIKNTAYFDKKTTTLPCRNTRVITIHMYIPTESNTSGKTFYTYEFIDHTGVNDHYDLPGIAEAILLVGYANDDISGYAPGDLSDMGFVPEDGTNLCAIANMLMPDNYKLIAQNNKFYGPEYEAGHDGQPYYGPTYQDVFVTENLTIFDKVIAHRDVKIGTRCVNDYVGD